MSAPARSAIAVIPAKGRSRRLPGKNAVDFFGRPMFMWSVEAAWRADRFERVVVSTESQEIADSATAAGAEVAWREPKLSSDHVPLTEVCSDLLVREVAAGRNYDVLTCLYATAPLRPAADVRAVTELVEPGTCDHAMAVCAYPLPPHQALRYSDDHTLEAVWPDLVELNDPEFGRVVVDNGSTYAVAVEAFTAYPGFRGKGMRAHEMDRLRSIDINHTDDLALARAVVSAGLVPLPKD